MTQEELEELSIHLADYIITYKDEWYDSNMMKIMGMNKLAKVIKRELISHQLLDK